MTKLLLLADDYTGALDTAVRFTKNGLSVAVTTHLSAETLREHAYADVIALDAESRHLPPREAYAVVYHAAKLAHAAGIPYVYKKTDSTLRGNIGAELDAAMAAYASEVCAFLPAFPRQGRTTSAGIHYVHGVALHESPLAKDPFNPVFTSSVQEILRSQCQQRTQTIPAPDTQEMPSLSAEPSGILVFDAETDAHIRACAAWIAQNNIRVMAGCAGLAEHLCSTLLSAAAPQPIPPTHCAKALILCGSLADASLEQVLFAERAGVASLLVPSELKSQPNFLATPGGQALLDTILTQARHNPALLVKLAPAQPETRGQGWAWEQSPGARERLVQNTGTLTAKLMREGGFDLLVVFGGDTLFGIIHALNGATLTPRAELQPGVVESSLRFGQRCCTLVTKAGGLGDVGFLPQILSRYGL